MGSMVPRSFSIRYARKNGIDNSLLSEFSCVLTVIFRKSLKSRIDKAHYIYISEMAPNTLNRLYLLLVIPVHIWIATCAN
mgnify:CR=1 FL=1